MEILQDKREDFEVVRTWISAWEFVLDYDHHSHRCILWIWKRFGWVRTENCKKPLPFESLFSSTHWWVLRGKEFWEKFAWFTIKRLGLALGYSSVVEHVFGTWVPGFNPQHQNKNENKQKNYLHSNLSMIGYHSVGQLHNSSNASFSYL